MLFGTIIGGLVGAAFGAIVTVAAAPFVTPAGSVSLGLAVGSCVGGALGVGATNAYDNQSTSASAIGTACVATGTVGLVGNAIRKGITS
jgi:hypothetical protein